MMHFVCSANGENLFQIKLQIKSLNVHISTWVQVFFKMIYYFTIVVEEQQHTSQTRQQFMFDNSHFLACSVKQTFINEKRAEGPEWIHAEHQCDQ